MAGVIIYAYSAELNYTSANGSKTWLVSLPSLLLGAFASQGHPGQMYDSLYATILSLYLTQVQPELLSDQLLLQC